MSLKDMKIGSRLTILLGVLSALLLLVGDQDATGNIRTAMPQWAKAESDCRLVIIPNARHAANLDNPEVFHAALLEFLQSRCRGH